ETADRIFDQLEKTDAVQKHRALEQISRAAVEVTAGNPQQALNLLDAVRAPASKIDAEFVQIALAATRGDLLRRSGKLEEAEEAYRRAIDASIASSESLNLPPTATKAYKGLTDLLVNRGDAEGALGVWESFRANRAPGVSEG